VGDFVDARALETVFEEHATSGVENSLLDLACMFARRAAIANRAPLSLASCLRVRFHRSLAFHRAHK
jgi:hypothetical protein